MTTSPKPWSLVIHGGAGAIERSQTRPETDIGVRAALNAALWIAAEKDSAEVFAKAVKAFKQLASGLLKTPA